MLRACILDFGSSWDEYLPLVEFAYNNSYQKSLDAAPFEVLYGRKCRTPLYWDIQGTRILTGPELVQRTVDKVDKIKLRLKLAQERQKKYADRHRRDLEFQVGEFVFLKVSPWKGVFRFGKTGIRSFGRRGKLGPRYIGPFEILERVGPVAYRLSLPSELERIHNVFHVSMLRQYIPDPSHVLGAPPVELRGDLHFEEKPVEILARDVRVLRNKRIPLVKVLWRSSTTEEQTWEREDEMMAQYPHLF